MKYIKQFLENLTKDVKISQSKTTESWYYDFGYGFVVRLSDHLKSSMNRTPTISISKIFNSPQFLIQIEQSPYPIIKNRSEVKEMVKNALEIYTLNGMTKSYLEKKKIKLRECEDWSAFWGDVCCLYPLARHFSKRQKDAIKKQFDKLKDGIFVFETIKKIKLTDTDKEIETYFTKKN